MSLAIVASSVGCSSSSLIVRSTPDNADVTFISRDGHRLHVGKTPVQLNSSTTAGLAHDTGIVQVSKEGFLVQSALVPSLGQMGGHGVIDFTLEQAELPKICQSNSDLASDMARGVVEVTSLIQRKRYADAGNQVQNLIAKYPGVAVLYDLKGNIAYLQRDITRALEAYRQSNQISSNNPNTKHMIDRLQSLQGGQ